MNSNAPRSDRFQKCSDRRCTLVSPFWISARSSTYPSRLESCYRPKKRSRRVKDESGRVPATWMQGPRGERTRHSLPISEDRAGPGCFSRGPWSICLQLHATETTSPRPHSNGRLSDEIQSGGIPDPKSFFRYSKGPACTQRSLDTDVLQACDRASLQMYRRRQDVFVSSVQSPSVNISLVSVSIESTPSSRAFR
jgi:hypothetical protein